MISRASFVALKHRNFRLIWLGLMLSFTGSMMQNAALLWHVSLLVPNNKGLALGLVGLVKVVPIVLFSMISGVVADALDRRKVMLVTQLAATGVAVGLAVLTFRGVSVVWPVYLLAGLGAAVGAFDLPARNALVPSLVPREHLPNAISLNTIMFQTASVAGPSLGGLLIAATSVGWVYIVNAISFGFVIVALLMMRDVPPRPELLHVLHRHRRRLLDLARRVDRAGVELDLNFVGVEVRQIEQGFDLHILPDLVMPVAARVHADELIGVSNPRPGGGSALDLRRRRQSPQR